MAIIEELFHDRTETLGKRASADIPYIVRDAADEAEVKETAISFLPRYYAGLVLGNVVIEERINASAWRITAQYEPPQVPETEAEAEPSFSFDTGGGSQHITQSIQTKGKYGPKASDALQGAIGYDGENVAGVDITLPVFNFTETHYLPDEIVTPAYKKKIFELTGTVNEDAFREFAAGEVLFLGAAGSRRGEEDWEITFRFAALPNKENMTVGPISGIAKDGWDYLWVQYSDEVDEQKKQLVKQPVAVYIEKVYERAKFAQLGLGVPPAQEEE